MMREWHLSLPKGTIGDQRVLLVPNEPQKRKRIRLILFTSFYSTTSDATNKKLFQSFIGVLSFGRMGFHTPYKTGRLKLRQATETSYVTQFNTIFYIDFRTFFSILIHFNVTMTNRFRKIEMI